MWIWWSSKECGENVAIFGVDIRLSVDPGNKKYIIVFSEEPINKVEDFIFTP